VGWGESCPDGFVPKSPHNTGPPAGPAIAPAFRRKLARFRSWIAARSVRTFRGDFKVHVLRPGWRSRDCSPSTAWAPEAGGDKAAWIAGILPALPGFLSRDQGSCLVSYQQRNRVDGQFHAGISGSVRYDGERSVLQSLKCGRPALRIWSGPPPSRDAASRSQLWLEPMSTGCRESPARSLWLSKGPRRRKERTLIMRDLS
jgi:hypothetical protein